MSQSKRKQCQGTFLRYTPRRGPHDRSVTGAQPARDRHKHDLKPPRAHSTQGSTISNQYNNNKIEYAKYLILVVPWAYFAVLSWPGIRAPGIRAPTTRTTRQKKQWRPPLKVVMIVTDTCSTMQKCWQMVADEFPWISILPCQPHVISLLLKDAGKTKEVTRYVPSDWGTSVPPAVRPRGPQLRPLTV